MGMRSPKLLVMIGLVLIISCSLAENDCGPNDNFQPTIHPKWIMLKSTAHGELWKMDGQTEAIQVVVVNGNAREQGKAAGELLRAEIRENAAALVGYCKTRARQFISFLPEFVIQFIFWLIDLLLPLVLNITWLLTKPYTPQRYFDELQGMAEGTGLPYMELVRISMFLELIKAACSLVGAWGPATENGSLYVMRALDWDVDSPFTKHPLITVYNTTEPNSIHFATFGYAGLIGCFTAINIEGFMISEKYWYRRDDSEGQTTRVGKPWHYVLRDAAEFAHDAEEAAVMLQKTARTCSIFIQLASKRRGLYRGVQYAANMVKVYDDNNSTQNDEYHPIIPGTNYWDKTVQPTHNRCLGAMLLKKKGHINPAFMYQELAPRHQTGNAQLIVYDTEHMKLYLAYSTYQPLKNAYEKPMFEFTLADLFAPHS
jgi:hypothetical protein